LLGHGCRVAEVAEACGRLDGCAGDVDEFDFTVGFFNCFLNTAVRVNAGVSCEKPYVSIYPLWIHRQVENAVIYRDHAEAEHEADFFLFLIFLLKAL